MTRSRIVGVMRSRVGLSVGGRVMAAQGRRRSRVGVVVAALAALLLGSAPAYANESAANVSAVSPADPIGPTPAVASLQVPAYMGRWYQLALYPNRFQAQCVSDTSATYRWVADEGRVEVMNACRNVQGVIERALGSARPRGAQVDASLRLAPASLEVAFAPTWLRWLPFVWGNYDVIRLFAEGEASPESPAISIVSEPSKTYLWVLAREPRLHAQAWSVVEAWLQQHGFDVKRLRREQHG